MTYPSDAGPNPGCGIGEYAGGDCTGVEFVRGGSRGGRLGGGLEFEFPEDAELPEIEEPTRFGGGGR